MNLVSDRHPQVTSLEDEREEILAQIRMIEYVRSSLTYPEMEHVDHYLQAAVEAMKTKVSPKH